MKRIADSLLGAWMIVMPLLAVAQQPSTQLKVVPLKPTSAASGKQMFGAYCATCHGVDAKGNGPAASALNEQPSDLTVLARKCGGKFPVNQVSAILQFGVSAPAHGSKEMPVWGEQFFEAHSAFSETEGEVQLRIRNLVTYVRSLQQ